MTTEDDFHRGLDANPDDHHLRMVFADWLDEQGDPRGPGYRALGKLRRMPIKFGFGGRGEYWSFHNGEGTDGGGRIHARHSLPQDWLDTAVDQETNYSPPWFWLHAGKYRKGGFDPRTRQDAEDRVALAFSKLPPERQTELLADPHQMARRVRHARMRRLAR